MHWPLRAPDELEGPEPARHLGFMFAAELPEARIVVCLLRLRGASASEMAAHYHATVEKFEQVYETHFKVVRIMNNTGSPKPRRRSGAK